MPQPGPEQNETPPRTIDDIDTRISGIAALGEPIRRALYRYVVSQDAPVSRDQAASGVGVPRHVAKFHLDKLEEDGLLDIQFSRPPGRTGPGAGRPSKLYRRSTREFAVSLPERRYDFAGTIMATAMSRSKQEHIPIAEALHDAATAAGREMGVEGRRRAGEQPSQERLLDIAREVLAEYGYEPRSKDGCMIMANCPFHALAQEHTELVCGMNLDLLTGFLDGLEATNLRSELDPAPNRCCVVVCQQ